MTEIELTPVEEALIQFAQSEVNKAQIQANHLVKNSQKQFEEAVCLILDQRNIPRQNLDVKERNGKTYLILKAKENEI